MRIVSIVGIAIGVIGLLTLLGSSMYVAKKTGLPPPAKYTVVQVDGVWYARELGYTDKPLEEVSHREITPEQAQMKLAQERREGPIFALMFTGMMVGIITAGILQWRKRLGPPPCPPSAPQDA